MNAFQHSLTPFEVAKEFISRQSKEDLKEAKKVAKYQRKTEKKQQKLEEKGKKPKYATRTFKGMGTLTRRYSFPDRVIKSILSVVLLAGMIWLIGQDFMLGITKFCLVLLSIVTFFYAIRQINTAKSIRQSRIITLKHYIKDIQLAKAKEDLCINYPEHYKLFKEIYKDLNKEWYDRTCKQFTEYTKFHPITNVNTRRAIFHEIYIFGYTYYPDRGFDDPIRELAVMSYHRGN